MLGYCRAEQQVLHPFGGQVLTGGAQWAQRQTDTAQQLLDDLQAAHAHAAAVIGQAEDVAGQAAARVGQIAKVITDAQAVAGRGGDVAERAAGTVALTRRTAEQAQPSLDQAQLLLAGLQELAQPLLRTVPPADAQALARLAGELPAPAEALSEQALPILSGMGNLGPDVSELLGTVHDLHWALLGPPGIGLLRRRGEERLEEGTDQRRPSRQPLLPGGSDGRSGLTGGGAGLAGPTSAPHSRRRHRYPGW